MDRRRVCSNCGAVGDGALYCVECGALATWRRNRSRLAFAGVVGAIVVLTVVLMVRSDDDPAGAVATTAFEAAASSTVMSTTTTSLAVGPLQPFDVTCSSEIPGYMCHALIDGDPTTAWNTLGSGQGAEILVQFEDPVRLTSVVFSNIVDDEGLMRNGRIREVRIQLTDSAAVALAELESGHGPFRVSISPDVTSGVVIRIISTYPGEHYQGLEPFEELALQELSFFGIPVP